MAQLCPHCSVENPDDAAFCGSCGKAVPASMSGGPRVVTTTGYASTGAGEALQLQELDRHRRKAFGVLLAVAILQAVVGGVVIAIGGIGNLEIEANAIAYVTIFGLAVIFLALSIWARYSPLPAAIVGLVLFCTVHLLDAIADPTAIVRGILVKIIVIVLLIQAIQSGIRHREIMRKRASA